MTLYFRKMAFCWLALPALAIAQADYSITDSRTPPEVAVGSPAGSYALSGLESFDPYSGSLAIHIPLVALGGRGDAGYAIESVIQQNWQAYTHFDNNGNPHLWVRSKPGIGTGSPRVPYVFRYTPGVVVARISVDSGDGTNACTSSGYTYHFGRILTRLVFMDALGTSHDLIDTNTNGQPLNTQTTGGLPGCNIDPLTGGTNRGTTFRAMDGSDLIFKSDATIYDPPAFSTLSKAIPQPIIAGWLYFPNGKKYRIDGSYVTSIEDRNGNVSSGLTDPLNRTTQISYAGNTASALQPGADTITYPGLGGPITVTNAYLSSPGVLASGQPQLTYGQLFPNFMSTSSTYTSPFDQVMITSITLPDGHSYTFTYTSYGDIASVTLPTGGKVVYTWPAALGSSCNASPAFCVAEYTDSQGNPGGAIFRRLLARDEYFDGGSTFSRHTTYSYSYGLTDPNGPTLVTVTDQDGSGNTISVVKHHYLGDASSTDNLLPPPDAWYNTPANGKETLTEYLTGTGQTLRQTLQSWAQRPCSATEICWFGDPTSITNSSFPHDPQLASNQITENSSVRSTNYSYDQNNNVTDQSDTDWSSGTSGVILRHTNTSYNQSIPYVLDLPSETKVLDGSSNAYSDTQYFYDEAPAPSGYSNPITGYDTAATPKGNLTTVKNCLGTPPLSLPCTGIVTNKKTYDITGNVLSSTDANGNPTVFDYTDSYSDGTGRNTYAHPTTIKNAKNQAAKVTYDYNSGKPTSFIDPNTATTSYTYADPFYRVTQILNPDGGYTNVTYDTPTHTIIYSDQTNATDHLIHSESFYDGFGRLLESRQFENSSTYISTTQTYDALGRVFHTVNPLRIGGDQAWSGSNVTEHFYDALNRSIQATTDDDNASVITSYAGNQTTVTDQAGKQRTTITDGLGRLTAVIEDPKTAAYTAGANYITVYGYDPLDDLLCVNQNTSATTATCSASFAPSRIFTYDSFKRLLSATNPETGQIKYSYDNAGNLLTKSDQRPVTTCFGTWSGSSCDSGQNKGYDSLNRPVSKSYSDGTPTVTYSYDSATNGKGRLAGIANSTSASSITAYDLMGHATASSQTTNATINGVATPTTYTFPSYTYNLAGSLVTETYPSQRQVYTYYDALNRPATLSGALTSQSPVKDYIGDHTVTSYTNDINKWIFYNPHGAPWAYLRGNGLMHAEAYNARLQMTESYESINNNVNTAATMLFVSCPHWGLDGWVGLYPICSRGAPSGLDNGNMTVYEEYLGGGPNDSTSQSFTAPTFAQTPITYDALNRLKSVTDSGWSRSFGYDAFGNMNVTANSSSIPPNIDMPGPTTAYSPKNQRTDQSYDLAGNLNSVQQGTIALTYDAENRQLTAGPSSYSYDGSGRRVIKNSGGNTTVYVYDVMGQQAAEYNTVAPSSAPCVTCYLSYDHLGSVRLVTNATGGIVSRHDYLPFGEEILAGQAGRSTDLHFGGTDNVTQHFTGKERDQESQLDYFGARYYGSALGRWGSADPVNVTEERLISPTSTLNKYIYGGNNPFKFVDPDGNDITIFYEQGIPGHTMMLVYNQQTGQSGFRSFGPDHAQSSRATVATGLPVPGTDKFGLEEMKTVDDLRKNFTSITIATSPEQAQKALETLIHDPDGKYTLFGNNCTSTCAKILRDLKLFDEHPIQPANNFQALYVKYGNHDVFRFFGPWQNGKDYGKYRPRYNPFDLFIKTLNCTKYTWTQTNSEGKVISQTAETVCK